MSYRNCKNFNIYWLNEFKQVISGAITNKHLSKQLVADIYNNTLIENVSTSMSSIYSIENQLSSWINLLREWFQVSINKYHETFLYYAKVKRHPSYLKIGITYDLVNREYGFDNNKYYHYKILHVYNNRYQAAYIEYKLRTSYCCRESEIIRTDQLNNVIQYINDFQINKKELKQLGWRF